MVKLLQEQDIDVLNQAVEMDVNQHDEAVEMAKLATDTNPGDLSDGGKVGGVDLYMMKDGKRVTEGRAVARQAWMWDGTPTTLTLRWDPNGKVHDSALYLLRKMHCMCCGHGGFRSLQCPNCVKTNCSDCGGRPNPKMIIRNFYLNKDDCPVQTKFYGDIDCFIPTCLRRGGKGYKTEEEMRMHARSRHKLEYLAHEETVEATKVGEVAELKAQLATLTASLLNQNGAPSQPVPVAEVKGADRTEEQKQEARDRMAKARAARGRKEKPVTA